MKYLVHFEKAEPVRWLGHLDLLRAFERAVRRARLPIAFTTGFNPRAKLTFASALGVGTTGEAEVMTIELTQELPAERLLEVLNARLPVGLRLKSAEIIADHGARDLLNSYTRAHVRLCCHVPQPYGRDEVETLLAELKKMPAWEIIRERDGRVRTFDLKPFIRDVSVAEIDGQNIAFDVFVTVGQEGGARPSEVAGLLARSLPGLELRKSHRVRLYSDTAPCAANHESPER